MAYKYSMTEENFIHYLTGIPAIDSQHWALIEQMNEIIKILTVNMSIDLSDKLESLKESLLAHCMFEENMLSTNNYPYFVAHTHSHSSLIAKMDELISRSKKYAYPGMIAALQHIIVDHIDHSDLQYTPYIIKLPTND